MRNGEMERSMRVALHIKVTGSFRFSWNLGSDSRGWGGVPAF